MGDARRFKTGPLISPFKKYLQVCKQNTKQQIIDTANRVASVWDKAFYPPIYCDLKKKKKM